MPEIYTTNDLILYLYNETELEDSVFIQKEIDDVEEVREAFNGLVAMKELLDHLTLRPAQTTVESILAYSKLHSYL